MRRKGKKGTLLKLGTDDALDDSVLFPFLPGNIDETLFTKLYGIDHGRLVAGGQELLNQSGDLGQALFSAAVGTASLREILSELQNDAEELFKPRASTKLVNRAISSFKEAQKRIKDSSLPVAEWKRLQKELSDALSAISHIEEGIKGKIMEIQTRVTILKAISLDPDFPDNPMDRSPVLTCYVGQREVDPIQAWHWCAGNPITEEQYNKMLGAPPVDPNKAVDLRTMKPAF